LTFYFYSIVIISLIIFILYLKREILFKFQKYLAKDKTILLTGGSLGVGRELLHLLISKFNCQVINLDIRETEFEAIKSEYKEKVINIACNVAKVDDMVQFLSGKNINPIISI
jgi:short-subunit dehydrogenase involved in D-alanine esterification of teichoic acids